jgi:tRNA (guanine37-N1)-methyltransferase
MTKKLNFSIITLFPEVFTYLDASVIKRARDKELIGVELINPREFTTDKHRTADDYPYGGGSGMVIKPEPVFDAVEHVKKNTGEDSKVIIMSPQGTVLNQNIAEHLAKETDLIIVCGHYEGLDERIYSLADMEISIGDYVLTGGELPAMVLVDTVSRMVPGVIDAESAEFDSFKNTILDYPHYTRPQNYRGMEVPSVLLSGNHEKIRKWRRKESLLRTLVRRPELLGQTNLTREDHHLLEEIFMEKIRDCM